jgi:hypothetical protein
VPQEAPPPALRTGTRIRCGPTRLSSRRFHPLPQVRGDGERVPPADEEPAGSTRIRHPFPGNSAKTTHHHSHSHLVDFPQDDKPSSSPRTLAQRCRPSGHRIRPIATHPAPTTPPPQGQDMPPPTPDEPSAELAKSYQESCHSHPHTDTPWNDVSPCIGLAARPAALSHVRELRATARRRVTYPSPANQPLAQFSGPFPVASAASAAVPGPVAEPRRTPSPPRISSLPSSPGVPGRSPPATVRSSSRT